MSRRHRTTQSVEELKAEVKARLSGGIEGNHSLNVLQDWCHPCVKDRPVEELKAEVKARDHAMQHIKGMVAFNYRICMPVALVILLITVGSLMRLKTLEICVQECAKAICGCTHFISVLHSAISIWELKENGTKWMAKWNGV
ncbi:hypothetical protein M0R45_028022 [Rubus argutus]|uniref:Uncharacterized protein n=1 Tax=Rubus argutus TaxID=59490 RepID=A0AAW1W3D7_RUBAR